MTPNGAPPGAVRVVNTFPLSDDQLGRIGASHPAVELIHRPADSQVTVDALVDGTANVLLADFAPTHRRGLPMLRWMQYSGAGVDDLAASAPWRDGIVVTTASGANAPAVAEYVIAAMFDVGQRVGARRAAQAERRWVTGAQRAGLAARPLAGRTVTIVGYGNVGRQIAARADALGMRVLAVKSRPDVLGAPTDGFVRGGDPDGRIPAAVVGPAALADVVAPADFVVVAAPLTDDTRGVLGGRVLDAMRPSSWLINVGRGDLFDEAVLVDRLRTGTIAGATLDVASAEPLPADSALWDLDNAVITPHVAGDFDGIWDAISELIVVNLRRFATGEELVNMVRPDDGY